MAEAQPRGPETLTITLTGRPPVRIVKSEWPIIAEVRDSDAQPGNEPSETVRLVVRRHADGNSIVYGIYTTAHLTRRNRRAGLLVDRADGIWAAILHVAAAIGADARFAQECISDLPPEVLMGKGPDDHMAECQRWLAGRIMDGAIDQDAAREGWMAARGYPLRGAGVPQMG